MMALPLFEASAAELHVFAAASLTDAMKENAANFEKENPTRVRLNFGASNQFEGQIEEAAPADVSFPPMKRR